MPDISRGTFGDCRVNSRWIPLLGPNTDVVYLIYAAVLTLWRHQLQSTSHQGTESVFSRCGQPHSRITQDGVVVMVVLMPADRLSVRKPQCPQSPTRRYPGARCPNTYLLLDNMYLYLTAVSVTLDRSFCCLLSEQIVSSTFRKKTH